MKITRSQLRKMIINEVIGLANPLVAAAAAGSALSALAVWGPPALATFFLYKAGKAGKEKVDQELLETWESLDPTVKAPIEKIIEGAKELPDAAYNSIIDSIIDQLQEMK